MEGSPKYQVRPPPDKFPPANPWWFERPKLSLLFVNKQVHDEAARAFYKHISFHFEFKTRGVDIVQTFIERTTSSTRLCIRSIAILVPVATNAYREYGLNFPQYTAYSDKLSSAFPKLKYVHLVLSPSPLISDIRDIQRLEEQGENSWCPSPKKVLAAFKGQVKVRVGFLHWSNPRVNGSLRKCCQRLQD